jgi:cysteinyl-tRNA synthetase
MIKSYPRIDSTIGNTPLVEIRGLNRSSRVKVFAKLEYFNPGGSIKDRVAAYMIEQAEKRGELTKDKVILEATSGNTGIGLALVAASKGYRLCLAMPESASEERKNILRALGAELVLTPANLRTDGAIEVAYTMMREHPGRYFGTDQFNNADNVAAHYHGTGEEIWRQTEGAVTMVVATLGTSGTAMGISRRLKEYNPAVRIIGVEPYLQHRIQGLKNMKESYRPGIYDRSRLDEKINIQDEDAFEMARRLAREEGLLVGMSSGAAMHAAALKARELEEGVIVVIFPDGGERYLSTDLFTDFTQGNLKIYNTATREKAVFRPIRPGEILMHSCGPTVYDVPHIGNFRRVVVSDLIRRYFEYQGFNVRHMMNIIDLDDRSIRGAEQADVDLKTYTEKGASAFLLGLKVLNVRDDDEYPRVSDHFDDMVTLVEKLVQKGYAYEKLRSVYFDISKLSDYGCLSNVDLQKSEPGRTVDQDDYEKDSPADFTLLKRSTLSELKRGVYFKTRWGNVRPSWHLECAATSMKYLGEGFDIHASGADVIFPHCENVLAIGRGTTGRRPANYWLHTELVLAGETKMSRSLGNAVTLEELERKGYRGREVRYFLLASHYRKPLHFSFGALETARNTIRRLDGFVQRLLRFIPGNGYSDTDQLIYDVKQRFVGAMDDDFNISGALASLFTFVNRVGLPLAQGQFSEAERNRILETLKLLDSVLGIMNFGEESIGEEVRLLLAERQKLRKEGLWAEADRIRNLLLGMGVEISDTQDGVVWRLISAFSDPGQDLTQRMDIKN